MKTCLLERICTRHIMIESRGALQDQVADRRGNTKRKTPIELSDEQYFFLKDKALELQKQNHSASLVSLLRELVESDRQEWVKRKARREGQDRLGFCGRASWDCV